MAGGLKEIIDGDQSRGYLQAVAQPGQLRLTTINLAEVDEAARKYGLSGVDLLGLSTRTQHALRRAKYLDLQGISFEGGNLIPSAKRGIVGARLGVGAVQEVRQAFDQFLTLSHEEAMAKIPQVLETRHRVRTEQKAAGEDLLEGDTSQVFFEKVGQYITDDTPICDLVSKGIHYHKNSEGRIIAGTEVYPTRDLEFRRAILHTFSGFTRSSVRSALNNSLITAHNPAQIETIGEFRRADLDELMKHATDAHMFQMLFTIEAFGQSDTDPNTK